MTIMVSVLCWDVSFLSLCWCVADILEIAFFVSMTFLTMKTLKTIRSVRGMRYKTTKVPHVK